MSLLAEKTNTDTVSVASLQPAGVRPFVKWAGGKTQLLDELVARVPAEFDRYIEPMVGGGALYFRLLPEHAVLGDLNGELLLCYRVVKERVESLITALGAHKHCKKHYYRVRNVDRDASFWSWTEVERAARFIYLNRTCFNGLYRVNSRGEFNVPFGEYKRPRIVQEEVLRACSEALQGAVLVEGSFEATVSQATAKDFIYFDPPYLPSSKTAQFTSYVKGGFHDADQLKLRTVCSELDERGVRWMVSNSYNETMLRLWDNFNISVVDAARAINSKGEKRGNVKEIIVTNY